MLRLLATIPQIFIENPLFLIEALLTVGTVVLALDTQRPGPGLFAWAARAFASLARRKRLSVVAVGLCALTGRLALLPILPIPQPHAHDEFSYLLAADTFASGRLTNPTHPMWIHFETMHVNQKPTYMSMYPPGQGMVLAAGKVLFGHPWWGVWLSVGFMCSAICWMLEGWLPPVWALLGGLMAVVRLGLFSYWMNSFWGGAVAATGGALTLGATARLVRQPRIGDACLLALGLTILAFSRPYEGLILSLPIVVLLVYRLGKNSTVVPIAVILSVAAGAMLYYNWRVAGSPFRMPYQINRETYVQARYFLWESINPKPVYEHAAMRDFYLNWQLKKALWASTPAGFLENGIKYLVYFWAFFMGPALTLPLLVIHRVARDHRLRLLVVTGAISVAGLAANLFFVQHYAAPATALLYALLLQGFRHLRFCRPGGRRVGVAVVGIVPLVCGAMLVVRLVAEPVRDMLMPSDLATWFHSPKGFTERADMLRLLDGKPGRHLVVVRYGPAHDPEREWVWNTADIDGAKVVWARHMEEARNRELLAYFAGRQVWLLDADLTPPRLSAYPLSGGTTRQQPVR